MSTRDNRLVGACKDVGAAAREILDWIGDGSDLVPAERVALLHEVYRTETMTDKLARALAERPGVAFVGPSRSGKTQLVASLLDPAGQLGIRFEGIRENIGYLKHLAPDSGRYGSAAVIRLTGPSAASAQNFPLSVRLLTMADVAKILGAAFITGAEVRDLEPDVAEIDRRMREARLHLRADSVPGLSEEDIWDIRHYFSTRFGEEPLVRALLTSGYWETLTELAMFLSNEDRSRLLSVLWGGLQPFATLFATLADAISSLGCASEARCALDAVLGLESRSGRFTRRADSILSSQALLALGQPLSQAEAHSVVVSSAHGQWVSISRGVLTAIVAEARLPVADCSAPLIEAADILELPSIDSAAGARVRTIVSDPSALGTIYMRAKAVYLLEAYVREQAITTMVACLEPGTSKVGELADLVGAWVERSHGPDAMSREGHANGLFVCFTKLDKEFVESQRRGRERKIDWGRRLHDTLLDGFGHHYSWPREWTTTRAFDNVHFIRNPNVKSKHLLNYASDGREQATKPEQKQRIEQARQEFVSNEVVRRHVAEPDAVWREAFELNDGGIAYLGQSITEVCHARIKQRHVRGDLATIGRSLKDRLLRYHVADDGDWHQDRRQVAALAVTRRLRRCAEEQRLGHLVRALQLSDAEYHDVLARTEAQGIAPRLLNSAASPPKPDAAVVAQSFAAVAMAHWAASARLFAQAERICQILQMPRESLLQLVDEVIAGAARLDLEQKLAREIESLVAGETDAENRVSKAALASASLIGDYMMWLGFSDPHSNSHPRRKGRAQEPIFQRKSASDAYADASDAAGFDQEFLTDWSQAFQALVKENGAAQATRPVDQERNRRLGDLLQRLTVAL